ncbi:MAG: hypothetical protein WCI20_07010 [bacterium]
MKDRNAPLPSGRVPVEVEGPTPPVIHRGEPIYTARLLPDLPLPKTVVAGRTDLHIDDTTVSLWVLSKPTIDWLGSQMLKWRDEDPSDENRKQLNGIIDAVENRIKQMTDDAREDFRLTVTDDIVIPYINHLLEVKGKVVSFTPDIDRLSADIVLESLKSFGRVKIHVPQLRFLRSNKAARELAKKRFSSAFESTVELGMCRLRIAHWICQERTNDCFGLAGKLPASFDIPLPSQASLARVCFMRFRLPE